MTGQTGTVVESTGGYSTRHHVLVSGLITERGCISCLDSPISLRGTLIYTLDFFFPTTEPHFSPDPVEKCN